MLKLVAAMIAVVALTSAGCSAQSVKPSQPPIAKSPAASTRAAVVHPAPAIRQGESRSLVDGLAVTLLSSSRPSTRRAFRHLSVLVTVLNMTDATITVGAASTPRVFDAQGRLLLGPDSETNVSSNRGPYWGHGGPYPGRSQSSGFAPGGTLAITMAGDIPEGRGPLTVNWTLDPTRAANFTIHG